jgi:hypothetical protein
MTSIELADHVLELARRELADLEKLLALGVARPGDGDHADTIREFYSVPSKTRCAGGITTKTGVAGVTGA